MALVLQTSVLLALIPSFHALLVSLNGFRPPRDLRRLRRENGTSASRCFPISTHVASIDASFDFSSALGWEQYYQRNSSDEDTVLEWHSSIPLEVVASYCFGRFDNGSEQNVLMPGCGMSRLTDAVLESGRTTNITLLDSSQTCIDQLKLRYKHLARISYVCGDAVKLSTTLGACQLYDVIVDKGLMDALFCGEGWNGPVAKLLEEASQLLHPKGVYLLVSYRLPRSTKKFVTEVGDKIGLTWEFDCKGSNDRVGISLARKAV
jgi:SAM-dependent methyltransferase